MPSLQIAQRRIGPDQPPLVIAEIGINHGGSLAVAKEMVRLAAASGCECIKHQTHFLDDEMTDEAKAIFPPNADVSIWHVMERCALSREEEAELKRYTESLGMIWISTPFSRAAADFLGWMGDDNYVLLGHRRLRLEAPDGAADPGTEDPVQDQVVLG